MILIDNVGSYSMYIKDLAQPPTQPANVAQITSVGATPLIVPSGVGDVTGAGTTGTIPVWTDGPNSIIGDGLLTQSGGNVNLPSGNFVLGAAGLITFPDNVRQTFNPGVAVPGLNVGSQAGDPTTPINGDIWYDSTGNLLRTRINGVTVSIASGAITINTTTIVGGTTTRLLYDNAGTVGEISGLTSNGSTTLVQTSAAAAAFSSGLNGATNPTFNIDNSVALQVDGVSVQGQIVGGGVKFLATSSGANAPIFITPKGNSAILIPSGTAALPALAFSSATTDGLFLISGGTGIASGGVQVIWFRSSGTPSVELATTRLIWGSAFGGGDSGIVRNATGVLGFGTSIGGNQTWFNYSGQGRLTADITNLTTTFANLTGCTVSNIISGRKYFGRLVIKCNNTTATEGIKFDFNGGTATVSAFWAVASAAAGGTTVLGTVVSTSLAGVMNFTTITGETLIVIDFSFVASGAGTLIPRFAENSTAVGTATAELGSFIWMNDCP